MHACMRKTINQVMHGIEYVGHACMQQTGWIDLNLWQPNVTPRTYLKIFSSVKGFGNIIALIQSLAPPRKK